MKNWYLTLVVAALCGVYVAGCGGAKTGDKVAISGTVTLKGQPLDRGTITFTSVDPSKQLMAGAQIQNGQFSISADQGLPPGRYRVRISAPVGGPEVAAGEAPGESNVLAQERIPPEWGAQSKQEVDVPAGQGRVTLKFDIP